MQNHRLLRLVACPAAAGPMFIPSYFSHTSAYIEALIEMDSAAECVGETHTDSLFRFLCSIHPGATCFLCVCLEPRERNVRLELNGVGLASIRSPCRCCFVTFVR